MNKTNHIQKKIARGRTGPIMFPCIEVADTSSFNIPKPKDSEARIYPESFFQHLLTFKFLISIEKDNPSCVNTEMIYNRYVPDGVDPNDQGAIDKFFDEVRPVTTHFRDTVLDLYKPVLDAFMEKCEYSVITKELLYYLADQMKNYERMLEIEHRVNVVQWLEINYGRLPSPRPDNVVVEVNHN